jgi:hypothetical protein
MKTEQLNLSDFTHVDVRGTLHFEIEKSDSYSVTTTRNWFKSVRAFKDSRTLIINHRWYDILGPFFKCRVKVMMPELLGLRISGASKGMVTGFVSSNDYKLEVRGASRLNGDISKGDAKFDVEGATRTELTGSVKELKLTKKKPSWALLALLAIPCIFFLLLVWPFNKPENVFPPISDLKNQTFDKVVAFIKSDDTNKIPYGKGFNCEDYTFKVWLNARWAGITGNPIILQYEDGTGHMVIGFRTVDKGDVFFEPQTDEQIRPRIGYQYAGETIRGIYYLDLNQFIALYNSPPYDPNIKIK